MTHPIELEIRAEIAPTDLSRVEQALLAVGFALRDTTRRSMLMSFGQIGRIAEDNDQGTMETDIRCRITNGSVEVVVKLGGVHAHDRKEISTSITPEMLPAFAKVVGALNMFHKVGSRVTKNFVRERITASLVSSPSGLSYLELEKMTNETDAPRDREALEALAQELKVEIMPGREAFINFCNRLTERDDWRFSGSEEDVERFLADIKTTGSDTKTPSP